MIRKLISAQPRKLWFLLGCATLFFGIFVKVTQELLEGTSGDPKMKWLDEFVLLEVSKLRVDWLNGPAVDITALGSTTVLTLLTAVTLLMLVMVKDRRAILHLFIASCGAGLISQITKHLIHRNRPEVIERLVVVSGFSYPSGHSLAASAIYFTLAILGCRHFRRFGERAVLFALSSSIVGLIAVSRLYLGVHYPSDVVSGVCLGAAWAFILASGLLRP